MKALYRVSFRALIRLTRKMQMVSPKPIIANPAYTGEGSQCFWLQTFPTSNEFQQSFLSDMSEETKKMIRYLLPNNSLHEYMSDKINTRLITSNSLKILIRQGYRDGINSDDGGATLFECIRLLNEQISLSRNTSVKESFDVRIMVTAVYDDSRPTIVHSNIYSYFYRITIENRSQDTVQVLARYQTKLIRFCICSSLFTIICL